MPKLGGGYFLHLFECFGGMALIKKSCLDRAIGKADIRIQKNIFSIVDSELFDVFGK